MSDDDHHLTRHRHLTGLAAVLRGLQERLAEVERREAVGEITPADAMAEIEQITKLGEMLFDESDPA